MSRWLGDLQTGIMGMEPELVFTFLLLEARFLDDPAADDELARLLNLEAPWGLLAEEPAAGLFFRPRLLAAP